jgi:putative intracellular protease/amidase
MTSVLMVLTSHDQLGDTGRSTGWYLPEAAHPWKAFLAAGFDVSFVSPLGGRPRMDGVDLTDAVQAEFLTAFGADGPQTSTPDTVDASAFDVIFYVGGHGSMWDFADNRPLAGLASSIYEAGGVVAAVCHGPAGLVDISLGDGRFLVDGKNVAAFTDAEEAAVGLTNVVPFLLASKLVERGAVHHAAPNFEANVVVDGRLVTGQNPASAVGVAEAVVRTITTAIAAA